ncbi:kinase-like domain-containing protein [Tribonema minus]|uniref:Kinase-like domain-containing protein n=1 Tax=Tribonema minus TaxID=303371 RepID=A0A835YSX4_9STRA|nr:kinase-like domain-containing protein [Tribonema minus]
MDHKRPGSIRYTNTLAASPGNSGSGGSEGGIDPSDPLWGFNPLRRFGGLSMPLLLHFAGVSSGGSAPARQVLAKDREEELAAYLRYMVACVFPTTAHRPLAMTAAAALPPQAQALTLQLRPPPPLFPPPSSLPQHESEAMRPLAHFVGDSGSSSGAKLALAPELTPDAEHITNEERDERQGSGRHGVRQRWPVLGGVGIGAAGAAVLSRLQNKERSSGSPKAAAAAAAAPRCGAEVARSAGDGVLGELEVELGASEVEGRGEAWAWAQRLKLAPAHSKLHRFRFVKRLGRGSHGTTFLVRQESEALEEAMNEARLLSLVGSADGNKGHGVVTLHDFFMLTLAHKRVAYLELEYCGYGDVAALLQQRGHMKPLSAREIATISAGICEGLRQLHACDIIHRDIKPGNILLQHSSPTIASSSSSSSHAGQQQAAEVPASVVVKVADLGVGSRLSAAHPHTVNAAGTMPYMAPEVRKYLLGATVRYDTSCDIWAVGAIMYAMAVGNSDPQEPLTQRSAAVLADEITSKTGSEALGQAALRALQADPRARPKAQQLYTTLAAIAHELTPLQDRQHVSGAAHRRRPSGGVASRL